MMTIADWKVNRLNISHVKRPIKTKLKCKQGQRKNQIMFSNAMLIGISLPFRKAYWNRLLETEIIFTISLKLTLIASDMIS